MFIEVSPLVSVEIEKIEAIEVVDAFNCLVYTSSRSFRVSFPKDVFISMIESRSNKKEEPMNKVEKMLQQIYSSGATPRP